MSTAWPLDADRLRRFNQAVMEPDIPSRPGEDAYDSFTTAAPLWPLHAFVRRPGEPDPFDGWCTVTLPVGSIRQACAELLRFGAEADVLAPPELRARFAEVAAALHRRYAQ